MRWEVIFPEGRRLQKSEIVEADACYVNPGNGLIFSKKAALPVAAPPVAAAEPAEPPKRKPGRPPFKRKVKAFMTTSRGFNAGEWADFRFIGE